MTTETFSAKTQFPKNRSNDLMLASATIDQLDKQVKLLGKRIVVYTPVFQSVFDVGGEEVMMHCVQAEQVSDRPMNSNLVIKNDK
jgi:hypothetical protein